MRGPLNGGGAPKHFCEVVRREADEPQTKEDEEEDEDLNRIIVIVSIMLLDCCSYV